MPVDLTRFDFYAKNFIHSDNVRAMSLEEIGQYVILLCESWLTGKDCTLPADPKTLANLCRGIRLSDKVLEMFPIVPELGRRRNLRLYEEWLSAVKRSEDGRSAVQARRDRSTTVEQSYYQPSTNSFEGVVLKPNQAVSIQTESNQESNFRILAIRYRAAMSRSHSKSKMFKTRYADAVRKYGEERTLACFDEWAQDNQWRKESLGNSGLRFFFTDLDGMMDEIREAEALQPKETEVVGVEGKTTTEDLVETKLKEIEAEKSQESLPLDQF